VRGAGAALRGAADAVLEKLASAPLHMGRDENLLSMPIKIVKEWLAVGLECRGGETYQGGGRKTPVAV